MEEGDKKERTYWGVKESLIDKALAEKIRKYAWILRIAGLIVAICAASNGILQLCNKYIDETVLFALSIVFVVIILAAAAIELAVSINLCKFKKQAKKAQEDNPPISQTAENKDEEDESQAD